MKVSVECCGGMPNSRIDCLKERCPIYSEASQEVYRNWPRAETGFGNLYGDPGERNYLAKVREILAVRMINPDKDKKGDSSL